MPTKPRSAIPGRPVDEANTPDQVHARLLNRARSELPTEIRNMSAEQCIAKLRTMGGIAKALRLPDLRQPGEDDQ